MGGGGRCRQGLHTHTAPAFGEGGWDTAAIPPALGKLRHSEGHSLIRGLCLAELRQRPALSTRLKQRKTASRVCVPSSMGSAWPGQQPCPDPACLGAPGCFHPQLGSSGSSASKGGSLHPTSHSAGGDPLALTEQWDFTLSTQVAGRSCHGLGAPHQAWGCPLPLCQELLAGQLGSSTNTPRMGQGSCKHTRGDGGDREILGTKGPAGGQPSPEGSRVGRKHPCPVLVLELGENLPCPANPGALAAGQAGRWPANLHRDVGVHGLAGDLHQPVLQRADPIPLHRHFGVLDLGESGGKKSRMRMERGMSCCSASSAGPLWG